MRVPYIPNDPDSLGGAIHWLIPKFTRGQVRFYCKLMTKKQKERYVKDGGDQKHEFQANVHLGKSKIAELFKKKVQRCVVLKMLRIFILTLSMLCSSQVSQIILTFRSKN